VLELAHRRGSRFFPGDRHFARTGEVREIKHRRIDNNHLVNGLGSQRRNLIVLNLGRTHERVQLTGSPHFLPVHIGRVLSKALSHLGGNVHAHDKISSAFGKNIRRDIIDDAAINQCHAVSHDGF